MSNLEIMFWLSIPIYLIGAYTFADWLAKKVNSMIYMIKITKRYRQIQKGKK